MKNLKIYFILTIALIYANFQDIYGQNSDKLVYIVSPECQGLEKGTNHELFRTILQGKLEEYALSSDYQAVARDETMGYIQKELHVQQSGGVSAESIVKLGEWTGANFILVSNIVGSNGYGTIKLNLYETETGRLIKVKSTSFQEDVQAYSKVADLICKNFFGISNSENSPTDKGNPEVSNPVVQRPSKSSNAISIPNTSFLLAPDDEPGFFNWEDAKFACAAKGEGWRLPTIQELKIMYYQKDRIGNLYGYRGTWKYWSSEEKNKRDAYYYDFTEGEDDNDDKKDQDKCVRCVKKK